MPSITPNMELVMQFLQGWPDTKFKQADIAKQIGMKPHVIGAMLTSLVIQGEIKREEIKRDIWFFYPKPVEKGDVAGSRTYEWKEMPLYDLRSHQRACEDSMSIENGGLV